ncbi:hypothetical protein GCM10010388_50990 [Streptomyces mauvecolor]
MSTEPNWGCRAASDPCRFDEPTAELTTAHARHGIEIPEHTILDHRPGPARYGADARRWRAMVAASRAGRRRLTPLLAEVKVMAHHHGVTPAFRT